MWRKLTFKNSMQNLLNLWRAIEHDYYMNFFEVCTLGIVEDMMPIWFRSTIYRTTIFFILGLARWRLGTNSYSLCRSISHVCNSRKTILIIRIDDAILYKFSKRTSSPWFKPPIHSWKLITNQPSLNKMRSAGTTWSSATSVSFISLSKGKKPFQPYHCGFDLKYKRIK